MARVSLSDTSGRAQFFRLTVLNNLGYWQAWLETHLNDAVALDRERNAIVKAISFGLDVDQAWPAVFELVTRLSPLMERRGHWDMWQWVLTRSAEAARRNEDNAGEVALSALLARLLFQQSRFKEAVICYRRTIRMARQIGDIFNEARGCTNLGYYFIEQGQWQRAEVLCCRALYLFEQINSDHGRAHTQNHLGVLYARQHAWQQAQDHLELACDIWQKMADQHGLMRGYINLGGLYTDQGCPGKAYKYLEKALDLAESTGDKITEAQVYLNMGQVDIIGGDLARAEKYIREAETLFKQFSNTAELARVWGNLGIIYTRKGNWERAIANLERSLHTWRCLNSKPGEINTLLDMIEYELARSSFHQASLWLAEVEQLMGTGQKYVLYRNLQSRLEKYRRSLAEGLPQPAAAN